MNANKVFSKKFGCELTMRNLPLQGHCRQTGSTGFNGQTAVRSTLLKLNKDIPIFFTINLFRNDQTLKKHFTVFITICGICLYPIINSNHNMI